MATMATMDNAATNEEAAARPTMEQVQQLAKELDEVDTKLADLQHQS